VPVDRLRREIDARKALETSLAEMRSQVEQLQQGYTQAAGVLREQAAGQVKELGLRHQEDLAMVDLGLTDGLGRQTLRAAWDGAPKDVRGKSPAEWWQGQVAAHRAHQADPEKAAAPVVPKPLQPYLPAPEQQPAQQRAVWQQPAVQQRAAPPGAPGPAKVGGGLDTVPIDQGMESFFQGLRSISS